MERIVLAYSGGLDTSVAIPWLKARYGADVIAVTMDLGQGKELEDVRNRALAAGAVRAHVLDVREEFASGYVVPALKADALYEDRYPMATSLGRPLIAQKLVEIAAIEQAGAIAHGCTTEENDRFRARRIRPRAESGARSAGAGSRVGHDEAGGGRLRQRSRPSGSDRGRKPVQHGRQPVGPFDPMRRA